MKYKQITKKLLYKNKLFDTFYFKLITDIIYRKKNSNKFYNFKNLYKKNYIYINDYNIKNKILYLHIEPG